ncbi:MAG: hypothetical protein ACKPJD_12460, partial [Planctomycetaceae bacterium]
PSLQLLRQLVSFEEPASTEFPSAFPSPQLPSGGHGRLVSALVGLRLDRNLQGVKIPAWPKA